MAKALLRAGLLLMAAVLCTALPIKPSAKTQDHAKVDHAAQVPELSETRKEEYKRYLDELIKELGGDPDLKKELEKMSPAELARLMELPGNHADERTPEDEEWRDEVEEQRRLQRHRFDKENDIDERPDAFGMDEIPEGEEEMEHRMRQQQEKMEEFEKQRHQQFVNYEMEKEHERRERLKGLSEKDRLEAEEKHQAEKNAKHKNHPKVHHPGSEAQLEEAWEHEGFDKASFSVENFFHLQDHNGDGQLDSGEVEAMLVNEVEKLHANPSDPEYHEELLRMRQHVVHEVDKNKDGMISMQEFKDSSQLKTFAQDDEWKGLDYDDDYTDEEFDEYEKMLAEHERQNQELTQQGEHGAAMPAGQEHHGAVTDMHVAQDHQAPAAGHHEQPPQHHEQPTQHHEQPPQHHEQPPQHHEQPPQHHEQPPQHHEQPPQHHEQPPQAQHHEQQQQHHEQQQQQQQQQHHEQQQQQQHHEQQQQQQQHHEQQQQQQHHEQQQQQQQHHEQQQQHHEQPVHQT